MSKIMQIIASETGGKSYNTYKYSFDSIGLPAIDYEDESNKVMKWQEKGETVKYTTPVSLKEEADGISLKPSIFTYFLDGSRRVFKVDDISYNKQVFPVIAGQVGVGCCKRVNKKVSPERFYGELVLSLPDKSNSDGWDDDAVFAALTKKVNEAININKFKKIQFQTILPYKTSKDLSLDSKLENRGIAMIQDYMIEAEKKLVAELVKDRKLNQNNYLLKDGSLEYKPMSKGKADLRVLQKIKNNYKWVVGVSKQFNPESLKDHTGKANANYIADLPVYHRTPVARYENREFLGDVQFAVWYIRLREKRNTLTPFDGVVKVEKIMMDSEKDDGIDSDTVDLITANIINERNPVCYGTDKRWANHLYPVFLTETFVKSKYISAELFLNLF